jgi:cytochrome c biogenesis protein CcmG/thiol:disulfide interchange protein DsbE
MVGPAVATAQDGALPSGIAVGAHAPGAPVRRLDGTRTDLAHFIGSKPAVIEFWAKWCGNCRELAPALHAAARKYRGRATFVTVAVSVDETPDDVARFAREHGFAGPVVYDATGAAVDAYAVPGTSFLIVVDRRGTVVYTGAGGTQDVDAAVRKGL